jgi:hypothetical protein
VLCESIPIGEVWSEVEKYIHALMQTNLQNSTRNIDLNPLTDKNADNILADLIVDYLAHPVQIIAESAARVCGNMILASDTAIIESIEENFRGSSDVMQMHLIATLHSIALQNPNVLQPFTEILMSMAQSPNFMISVAALNVANLMGVAISTKPESKFDLPVIYQLAILEDQPPEYERQYSADGVLPDTRYASDLLRIYEAEISEISRMSGFPIENIRARVIQVMNDLQEVMPWKEADERELNHNLRNTGLRLTYTRPRSRVAIVALGRVWGELYKSGHTLQPPLGLTPAVLSFYDPEFILLKPETRPKEIKPILAEDPSRFYVNEAWKDQIVDDDFKKLLETYGENIVIGEFSQLALMSDGKPTEIRQSQFLSKPHVGAKFDGPERFFEHMIKKQYAEYRELTPRGKDISLVIFHSDYGYISQSGRWLAFNPFIARKLHWTLSSKGLFRWIDKDGEVMVESIWWTDSTLTHSERLSAEVGEGWLVVATPKGWSILQNLGIKYVKQEMIERQYYVNERFTRNYRVRNQ